MFEDLTGKVAVVTGGARGLGFSLASALAQHGVHVGLVDLLPDVEASAGRLRDQGVASHGCVADVTDPDAVEAAFAEITTALGVPQILVTAAGITIWDDSVTVEPATWRKVLAVNLDGTFFACQSFARRLLAQESNGSALLISSMSAAIVNRPQNQASYNASKAAVSHLASSLGVEWAAAGVRVNAIAPGYFLSDMTRQFIDANPDLAGEWTAAIPMQRMGEPEDLHGLALYLASDASSYLTGQTIVIDGGYTAV